MEYDPKLKEAMAEIKAILSKHDIAGAISLVSETHSEYRLQFPSWSMAQLTEKGLRFRGKAADYPNKEAANEALTRSLHVLLQIRDLTAQHQAVMLKILDALEKHVDFDHTPYADHTPHRSH
jgi:hypothetical protein